MSGTVPQGFQLVDQAPPQPQQQAQGNALPSGFRVSQQPLIVGDSIAGGLGGIGHKGAGPKDLRDFVSSDELPEESVRGRDVVLSGGASNNPAQVGMVADQINALRQKGAGNITLLGTANSADANNALMQIAKGAGARYVPLPANQLSPDGVHPTAQGYASLRSLLEAQSSPEANIEATVTAHRPPGSDPHAPPAEIQPIVNQAADKYGVPRAVANFVGSQESGWNPGAVGIPTSSGRAQGMWQFMPGTAKSFGIDPNDIPQSTDAAMKYLSELADKHHGDWESAIADYGTFSTGKGPEADAQVRQNYRNYIGNQTPVAQDMIRGVGTGLVKGVGTVLGMPSDIFHMIDTGSRYALAEGAAKLGLISPEDADKLLKLTQEDEASPGHYGSDWINNHLIGLARSAGLPLGDVRTTPGQYAETISSFLPGSVGMGGAGTAREALGSAIKYGVVPGATSETAGQLTKGTPLEPYARAAGAIAPAVPLAAMGTLRRIAGNPAGNAMSGVSDAQEQSAQALLDASRNAGAPLTVPEAVQQVTNSGTRLGDIQRVVEQSPKGAEQMRPFFAQRPAQTQNLGQQALGAVAPPAANPYEIAPRVQEASDAAVSAADRARTAATSPLYTAAAQDNVPYNEMEAFIQKIDGMIAADRTGLVSRSLIPVRDALTGQGTGLITDIGNLDNARKYFRDLVDKPPWQQDAVPKFTNSRVRGLVNELDDMMERHSPNFSAGKALHAQISRDVVDPLIRSPTGQLASAEGFEKQAQVLFNPNPLPHSERAVGQAVRQVAQSDPDAAKGMVRLYLERSFNELTQANLPGENQWGGPKFRAAIAGNSQQAKNLEAAVKALPQGDVRWNAFNKAMDIFQAMGRRQPVGSQTEFNRMVNDALKTGKPIGEVLSHAASPGGWLRIANQMYERYAYGQNTAELARIFTEGNVADLRNIAQAGSRSLRGQVALMGALGREGAETSQEGPTVPP